MDKEITFMYDEFWPISSHIVMVGVPTDVSVSEESSGDFKYSTVLEDVPFSENIKYFRNEEGSVFKIQDGNLYKVNGDVVFPVVVSC